MVDFDYFTLAEKEIRLYSGILPVTVLSTLDVIWDVSMHSNGGGLETDVKFGTTEDGDQVVPYLDDCEYPDVMGYYYKSEILAALKRLGHKKVSDQEDRILLGTIINE